MCVPMLALYIFWRSFAHARGPRNTKFHTDYASLSKWIAGNPFEISRVKINEELCGKWGPLLGIPYLTSTLGN